MEPEREELGPLPKPPPARVHLEPEPLKEVEAEHLRLALPCEDDDRRPGMALVFEDSLPDGAVGFLPLDGLECVLGYGLETEVSEEARPKPCVRGSGVDEEPQPFPARRPLQRDLRVDFAHALPFGHRSAMTFLLHVRLGRSEAGIREPVGQKGITGPDSNSHGGGGRPRRTMNLRNVAEVDTALVGMVFLMRKAVTTRDDGRYEYAGRTGFALLTRAPEDAPASTR